MEGSARDGPALGVNTLSVEEQKLWEIRKEELEKELYDVSVCSFVYALLPCTVSSSGWILTRYSSYWQISMTMA